MSDKKVWDKIEINLEEFTLNPRKRLQLFQPQVTVELRPLPYGRAGCVQQDPVKLTARVGWGSSK